MPNETLIAEIENALSEIVRLGGENERSQIVPNLTVQDSNPTGLTGFVIVSDDRDGDNILAKKVNSVIYADNDLVNVIFPKGGEAIAFQQGSQSANANIWEVVAGTSTDISYNKGDVGIGKSVPPDATLEILDTAQSQLRLTYAEDTQFVDFTLDTNHDLTITPSSTGQIILQPTTDSTDFFQVLDAGGGDPVLNVDTTNERVGIGTSTPTNAVAHISKTVTSAVANQRGLRVVNTFDGAGVGAAGMSLETTHEPSGNITTLYGALYQISLDPPMGVTITNAHSFWTRVVTGNDSGAVTQVNAIYVNQPSMGTIKPTTSTGITVKNQGVSGITTTTGLVVDAQSGSTTNYAATLNGLVGVGTTAPLAQLHIDQSSPTAAIPVAYFDQADVSEEMFQFNTTIGVGNAIEAVGAKTLTTTHFIKVTLPGALTRYFPVGTIA